MPDGSHPQLPIDELQKKIHAIAKDHGWWDGSESSYWTKILLVHSEISEAVEELRDFKPAVYYHDEKPEGWAVELADAIIRILDIFEKEGLSANDIIQTKMSFNHGRPYRHGGKAI